MNKRTRSFVNMTTTVLNVLNKNESVWSEFTRFGTSVANFKALKTDIDKRAADAQIVTTGGTEDKSNASNDLLDLVSKLSKRASIYAVDQNNMELHDSVRVSRGVLSQLSGKAALNKITAVYNRMKEVEDELVPYGITADDFAKLKELIDAFDDLSELPRTMIVERSMHLQTLPQLITSMRKVLYEMDGLITFFDGTDFEAEYKNARKIVDPRVVTPRTDEEKTEE